MKIHDPKKFKNRKKDWRKPYRGSSAWDYSCHNHRSCSYCRGTRTFFDAKRRHAAALDYMSYLAETEDEDQDERD